MKAFLHLQSIVTLHHDRREIYVAGHLASWMRIESQHVDISTVAEIILRVLEFFIIYAGASQICLGRRQIFMHDPDHFWK